MELDVSELPLVGGHPALDLVNTLARGVVASRWPGWLLGADHRAGQPGAPGSARQH